MSQHALNKAWLGLIIVLLILLSSGWYIFDKYFQHELDAISENTKKELVFIGNLVQEQLQKRDYEFAQHFITNWGKGTPGIVDINLTSGSGFELASFSSSQTPFHELVEEIKITYSYDGVATLKLRKSLDNVYVGHRRLLYELLAGYVFITLVLTYLTSTIIRIQKQKQEISFENKRSRRTERRLVVAQQIAQLGSWELDLVNKKLDWSAEVYRIFDIHPADFDVSYKTFIDLIHPDDREFVEKAYNDSLRDRKPYNIDHRLLLKDGRIKYVNERCETIYDDSGKPLRSLGTILDITERKQAEDKARQGVLVLDSVFQALPDLFFMMEADGTIIDYRARRDSDLYVPAETFLGKRMQDVLPSPIAAEFAENIDKVKEYGEMAVYEYALELAQGVRQFEARLSQLSDGTEFIAVIRDITERKQQDEKILHQAHFDALTDLPNRFLSLDRLSQLISEAQRNRELVAIVFLDLDDFKKINDTLGHDLGDKLLIKAANRLQSEIRSGDTVGRLGGDEFIVLLGGLSEPADAQPIVENLLYRFRDAFRIDGRELILTASVGIAIYPDDGNDPSELLRNADSAMYHSKDEGRNTYSYFTSAMNQGISRRLALEEQMHGALDRSEYHLKYQPKVEISSNRIVGVEALLRWNNPALGEVSPEEFIPIAEQTGLIIPIGQFVLNKALEEAANWQQKYEPLFTIAINLSPRQFRDPNLIAFINKSIAQSGVLGQSLEMEITEGVLMSGDAHVDEALSALNELGICIAMDDFGTGYSSLSYLRRYPFDVLKIDRSFVRDITIDNADRELVIASITMAHSLGLKVVAEGVETKEQMTLLAEQGCEFAQGYLFSKPVTAEEITDMLEAENGN